MGTTREASDGLDLSFLLFPRGCALLRREKHGEGQLERGVYLPAADEGPAGDRCAGCCTASSGAEIVRAVACEKVYRARAGSVCTHGLYAGGRIPVLQRTGPVQELQKQTGLPEGICPQADPARCDRVLPFRVHIHGGPPGDGRKDGRRDDPLVSFRAAHGELQRLVCDRDPILLPGVLGGLPLLQTRRDGDPLGIPFHAGLYGSRCLHRPPERLVDAGGMVV